MTLSGTGDGADELVGDIREHVAKRIGKLARPKRIIWADDLPKTRSGKIMRRLLRDIAEGRELGDVTTLRDPDVMSQLEGKIKERGRTSERGEAPLGGHRRRRAARPPDHGAGDERHRLVADDPVLLSRVPRAGFRQPRRGAL